MTKDLFRRGMRLCAARGALAMLVAGLATSPALAATSTSSSSSSSSSTSSSSGTSSSSSSIKTSSGGSSTSNSPSTANCATPALSEPFVSYGDTNEYALAPGLAFDSFTGTGWTLSGGATITSATLADGSTSPVLSLPDGAQAVSPPMCVQYDYPTARMMVRDASGTDGLTLNASYAGTNTQVSTSYSVSGQGTGWTASPALQTHPGNLSGWQLVVFTLVGSKPTAAQIYNFYVDPHASW